MFYIKSCCIAVNIPRDYSLLVTCNIQRRNTFKSTGNAA